MLTNKRAIVTGGSRGIGRAIVKKFAAENCSGVLLSDIVFINSSEECAREIQDEMKNSNTKMLLTLYSI